MKLLHVLAILCFRISDVSLECAVNRTTDGGQATAVEGCICPQGYKGLSCEDCAPGYTRSGSGLYLGTCVPCNCNRKSSTCDPEDGVCLDCRDYTTGRNCEECLPGYFKDPRSGGCLPEDVESGCSCDPRGSVDLSCEDGDYCLCKDNVEGMNCDRCKPGTFALSSGTPDGCSKCFCSGVTDECSDARLYWSTLRLNAQDKKYMLKEKIADRWQDRSGIQYNDDTKEMVFRIFPEDMTALFYWSLPQDITGNKLGAYGGNLTIISRFESAGRFQKSDEPLVIIVGDGIKLKHNGGYDEGVSGAESRFKITMAEGAWLAEDAYGERTATREDILAVLSNIQEVLVLGSMGEETIETGIRKTMLDIGVPQMTGAPLVPGAEECRCPPGYAGRSCESCAQGFYRNWSDQSRGNKGTCDRCACSGNEDSCSKLPTGQLECVCKAGYSGPTCEYRGGQPEEAPISITIREPRIQIVGVGSTVTFNCNAMPRFRAQDPLSIVWAKENGILPFGRSSDDGQGLLVITSVRSEDSGTYVCTATTGTFVNRQTAVLTVGGESEAPTVRVEPVQQGVREGERVQLECIAEGSPPPTVSWRRANRLQINQRATVRGNILYIDYVTREDEGEYVCTAENPNGRAEATAQVYVSPSESDPRPPQPRPPQPRPPQPRPPQPRPPQPRPPQPSSGISVSPQDLSIGMGDVAVFVCEVNFPETYQISWDRSGGSMPYAARKSEGSLEISGVRPEDSGIYVCTAIAPSGAVLTKEAQLFVSLRALPPSVRIEPEEQNIGQGGSTELRCIGSGDPAPTVEWSKVGEDLESPNLVISGEFLTLKNAAVSDRGMYICTAENSGGSARASSIIEVERREPPVIEIYPQSSQTITKPGSVLFQCRIMGGIPNPQVSWSRIDGQPLMQNIEILGGGVLRINRVTGAEAGQYKCTAQNEVGSVEAVATLEIQEVPSIQLNPKGSVTMQVGTPLKITCSARGDPPPSVSWKKLGENTRQLGVFSPVYEVPRLTKEDEGTYACVARNSAGDTEERVQIIVLEEDEFMSESNPGTSDNSPELPLKEDQPVKLGSNVRLECLTVGGSGPFFSKWVRADNQQLPPRHYQQSGILYLVNVDQRDEGIYICDVTDNRGTYVYQIQKQIILINPPIVTLDPARQTVNPGDSPTIMCRATGKQPISVYWSREDGAQLPNSVYQSDGLLQFRSISVRDAGRYSCTARNSDGENVSTAEVIVNDYSAELSGSPEPERISASMGASVELPCRLPQGAEMVWRRDGGVLPPTAQQIGMMLVIDRVSEQDSGRYICSGPTGTQYTDLRVERVQPIRNRPVVIVESSEARPYPGGALELSCRLEGESDGEFTWKKVGSELRDNVKANENRLMFDSLESGNQGLYRCNVKTDIGIFYSDFNLLLSAGGEGMGWRG